MAYAFPGQVAKWQTRQLEGLVPYFFGVEVQVLSCPPFCPDTSAGTH